MLGVGQRVAVAVRPEKTTVSRERPQGPNALAGEVWDIGYLGDWTIYRVKLDDGRILRVSRANTTRFVEQPIELEERVHVGFPPDAAVILSG